MIFLTMSLLLTFAIPSHSQSVQRMNFPVFWNAPTEPCLKKHIPIPLDKYNIKHNENQTFFGNMINIFYEHQFGAYPYFKQFNASQPVNGGLPQLCNLTKHLEIVRDNVTTRIPNASFNGLAVIDLEEWKPLYRLHWGSNLVYQTESVNLVKQKQPTLSDKAAKRLAEQEFNAAAKNIFLETIQLCRQLRPNALWGFYGFPRCNYDAGQNGENTCSTKYQKDNEEMEFLTSAGNVLFPSIYVSSNDPHNGLYIEAILRESLRVATFTPVQLPIYSYSKFEYNPFDRNRVLKFYTKEDLDNSIKQSADFGASGLILWSTSYHLDDTRCQSIADYVDQTLGPYINQLQSRTTVCPTSNIGSNSRSVLDIGTLSCSLQMQPTDSRCSIYDYLSSNHAQTTWYDQHMGFCQTGQP